jgi:hypothetical protein
MALQKSNGSMLFMMTERKSGLEPSTVFSTMALQKGKGPMLLIMTKIPLSIVSNGINSL